MVPTCKGSSSFKRCDTFVVARLEFRHDTVHSYCRVHLNDILDSCDAINMPFEQPLVEPTKFEWIAPLTERWCMIHRWPAVMCLDIRHGLLLWPL